jgi:UDP-N-acetylmuramate dehydrogenase
MIAAAPGVLAEKLRLRLRGPVTGDAPLARHTSFKIGGPADVLAVPADVEDLRAALAFAREEGLPVHVLGGGSNTLVRDGGVRGLVLQPGALQDLERREPGVRAGAGVRVSRLLAFCTKHGLAGLEVLSGVPGTVGGAIWGNAGAWGGAVADCLDEVELVLPDGRAERLRRSDIPFRYRASGLPPGAVLTAGTFALRSCDPADVRRRISGYLVRRNAVQPVQHRSAGSIFKNPPGDFAGRLVEQAGLKGTGIGGAVISERHGNFIVNRGGARATEVLALMELARRRVRETAGIDLELEVRVIGED